jgi:hypothetical protein
LYLLQLHTAGIPTDDTVKWTHLKPAEIAKLMLEKHGIPMSHGYIKRLLKKHGYCRRRLRKEIAIGTYGKRNEQFEIIFYLIRLFNGNTGPILSFDTKKKERLGNLYRDGYFYSNVDKKVYDHDFHYLSQGSVIPHGIFDVKLNKGYVSIGTSKETAAFICDNILWWWENFGMHNYPGCKQILLLCDSGGANSYRHHAFKKEAQRIAKQIGIRIIISHYPPYSSKWNPIEHRLFPHMHRAMQGVVFTDYEIVKELIRKTHTKTGLSVVVRIVRKDYQVGIKTDQSEIDQKRIFYHKDLPDLNYSILP